MHADGRRGGRRAGDHSYQVGPSLRRVDLHPALDDVAPDGDKVRPGGHLLPGEDGPHLDDVGPLAVRPQGAEVLAQSIAEVKLTYLRDVVDVDRCYPHVLV